MVCFHIFHTLFEVDAGLAPVGGNCSWTLCRYRRVLSANVTNTVKIVKNKCKVYLYSYLMGAGRHKSRGTLAVILPKISQSFPSLPFVCGCGMAPVSFTHISQGQFTDTAEIMVKQFWRIWLNMSYEIITTDNIITAKLSTQCLVHISYHCCFELPEISSIHPWIDHHR